jgi:hypothetical protein
MPSSWRRVPEAIVDVVEAGTAGARPAFRDERSEEKGNVSVERGQRLRRGRPLGPGDEDPVPGLDLLQQLPHEQRNADHVHQAQNRMVMGPRELIALARAQAKSRMITRMKELRGLDRTGQAIEHLEVDHGIAVRFHAGG